MFVVLVPKTPNHAQTASLENNVITVNRGIRGLLLIVGFVYKVTVVSGHPDKVSDWVLKSDIGYFLH